MAIARKLLVVIWHVLSAKQADQQADVQAVARRLFRWATTCRLETSLGLSRSEFVRQTLDHLGLGDDIEALSYNGKLIQLPPSTASRDSPEQAVVVTA